MSLIRPAQPVELPGLCDQISAMDPWLHLGVTADELLNAVHTDALRITWVLEDENSIRGCIMFRPQNGIELMARRGLTVGLAEYYERPPTWSENCYPDGGYVSLLAALPGCQGAGVGLGLLRAAEKETALVSDRLYLCVSESNASARRFYERNGYEFLAHIDNCIRLGNTELLLRKILTLE